MAAKGGPSYVEQYKELWYTNMILLGFKPSACEDSFKVPVSVDMFTRINKKGSEVVLQFLLSTLDPGIAKEKFRDSWPICDKKQEQDFRKTCVSWLGNIAKENPETKLPRLCASLLLSPGGDKYYVFLYKLSKHVLMTQVKAEAEQEGLFVSSFLTEGVRGLTPAHRDVSMAAMKSHIQRNTRQVVERLKLQSELHKEWEKQSSQLVREYQSTSKSVRELKKQLEAVREESKMRGVTCQPERGQPRSSAEEKVLALSAEVMERQRSSRMEKTRSLWRSLEEFEVRSRGQREVVESVLQGEADQHTVDARDIIFQVPEVLMGDYELMVQSGQAGNLYQEGKLNLITLVKLYNCALRKLRDCLASNEVPSFDQEAQWMTEKSVMQRTLLATVIDLKSQLDSLQTSLHVSVEKRESKLKDKRKPSDTTHPLCTFRSGHAPVLTLPPLTVPVVGLLPPSPDKSLLAQPCPSSPAHLADISLRPEREVSTPEAMRNISMSVHAAARSHQAKTADINSLVTSEPSKIPVSQTLSHPKKKKHTSQSSRKKTKTKPDLSHKSGDWRRETSRSTEPDPITATQSLSRSPPRTASSKVSTSLATDGRDGPPASTAYDILADQIAEAVSSQTEEQVMADPSPVTPDCELHSVSDPMAALGQSAFVSKDLISRTPLSKKATAKIDPTSTLSPLPESPLNMPSLQTSSEQTSPPRQLPTPNTTSTPPPEEDLIEHVEPQPDSSESPIGAFQSSPLSPEAPDRHSPTSLLELTPSLGQDETLISIPSPLQVDTPTTSAPRQGSPDVSSTPLIAFQTPKTVTDTVQTPSGSVEVDRTNTSPLLSFQTPKSQVTNTPATMGSLLTFQTPKSHVTNTPATMGQLISFQTPKSHVTNTPPTMGPLISFQTPRSAASQSVPNNTTPMVSFRTPKFDITNSPATMSPLISFQTPRSVANQTPVSTTVPSNTTPLVSFQTPKFNITNTPTSTGPLFSFQTPKFDVTNTTGPLISANQTPVSATAQGKSTSLFQTPKLHATGTPTATTPAHPTTQLPAGSETPSGSHTWLSSMEPLTPPPCDDFNFEASLDEEGGLLDSSSDSGVSNKEDDTD